ncbi:hypothetical protein WJX79_006695 [Trebouxia sp. C0005]
MACLPTRELWLCGTHRPCRQMHIWLQPCRRRTAADNLRISESFSKQAFAQPHTASGVLCQATAAQPQKQQGKDPDAGLPDISLIKRSGGRMMCEAAGSNAFLTALVTKPNGEFQHTVESFPPAALPPCWAP